MLLQKVHRREHVRQVNHKRIPIRGTTFLAEKRSFGPKARVWHAAQDEPKGGKFGAISVLFDKDPEVVKTPDRKKVNLETFARE